MGIKGGVHRTQLMARARARPVTAMATMAAMPERKLAEVVGKTTPVAAHDISQSAGMAVKNWGTALSAEQKAAGQALLKAPPPMLRENAHRTFAAAQARPGVAAAQEPHPDATGNAATPEERELDARTALSPTETVAQVHRAFLFEATWATSGSAMITGFLMDRLLNSSPQKMSLGYFAIAAATAGVVALVTHYAHLRAYMRRPGALPGAIEAGAVSLGRALLIAVALNAVRPAGSWFLPLSVAFGAVIGDIGRRYQLEHAA